MIYRIRGLNPSHFASQFAMTDDELMAMRARRETVSEGRYPCRVSLEDAKLGEEVLLTHFTNHDVEGPYRHSFAVFVRASIQKAAEFIDTMPPILRSRPIALRGYTKQGMLSGASLALSDDVDTVTRTMLADPKIAYIDAHNAMHGCFAARIERYGDAQ